MEREVEQRPVYRGMYGKIPLSGNPHRKDPLARTEPTAEAEPRLLPSQSMTLY